MEAGGPPTPERSWRSLSLHGVWEPVGWPPISWLLPLHQVWNRTVFFTPVQPGHCQRVCLHLRVPPCWPWAPCWPWTLWCHPSKTLGWESLATPAPGGRQSRSREGAIPDSRPLGQVVSRRTDRPELPEEAQPEWEHPQHEVTSQTTVGDVPGAAWGEPLK